MRRSKPYSFDLDAGIDAGQSHSLDFYAQRITFFGPGYHLSSSRRRKLHPGWSKSDAA